MPHVHTGRDVEDLHAVLLEKQSLSAKGQANGYAGLDADGKVPSAQLPASQSGAAAWADITGKPDEFPPEAHEHTKSDITDFAHNHDSDYAALVHTHDYAATNHNHDAAYSAINHTHDYSGDFAPLVHDHDGTYEPADAAIQTHVLSAHAPANAQKNSDITKAEIEAKLTGEIDSHSHAGGSSWEFPVGYVLISTTNTNPSTFLGYGTWSAFGAGRVLVGLNASDADFDTAEETGGAKTSSAVVNHTHTVSVTDPGHTHQFLPRSGTSGSVSSIVTGTLDTSSSIGGANQPHVQSATTGITATTANPAGGVASFSIMPPYIVVYFFERTA